MMKRRTMRQASASMLAIIVFMPAGFAHADMTGKVVGVTDGDTLTVGLFRAGERRLLPALPVVRW